MASLKELPKFESKLKTYTFYSQIIFIIVAFVMIIWYIFRVSRSGSNDSDPSIIWSVVHLVLYIFIGLTITVLGLVGVYTENSQFILWFIFGCLPVMAFELICIVWNQFINCEK